MEREGGSKGRLLEFKGPSERLWQHKWTGWDIPGSAEHPSSSGGQSRPGLLEAECSVEGWGQGLFPSARHLWGSFWETVLRFRFHSSEERLTSWRQCNQGPLIPWGNWNMRYTQRHWRSCLSGLEKRRLRGHLITTSGTQKGLWGNQIFSQLGNKRIKGSSHK